MAAMTRTGTKRKAAKGEGDSARHCCFEVNPVYFRGVGGPHKLGQSCQFANEFPDWSSLIQVAGHWFCTYHLPYNEVDFADVTRTDVTLSNDDRAKLKSAWSEDQQEAFNKAILKEKVEPAHEAKTLCDLTGVVFPGHFSTQGASLPCISLAHARFSGGIISFEGSWFAGPATFEYAQFSVGEVWFDRTNFRVANVDFVGASFACNHTSFEEARFDGGAAIFKDAKFTIGAASFSNAVFCGGAAVFSGAQFVDGPASFEAAEFSGGDVRFVNTRFGRDVCFAAPKYDIRAGCTKEQRDFDFRNIDFGHAEFCGRVTFENRQFTQHTDFNCACFTSAPEFHGCTLHQDTTFPPMENFGGREGEAAARAYRTLKLAMGQHRATDEEAMFWALEQIATRSTLKPLQRPRDIMPWVFSWLYEKASFYGLSVTRPLVLFLASTLIGFPLYVYMLMHAIDAGVGPYDEISFQQFANTFSFSMRQVVRPFDIWSRYDADALELLYPAACEQRSCIWTKLIATGQSVVSLALVTLFLLALRRRFRMV